MVHYGLRNYNRNQLDFRPILPFDNLEPKNTFQYLRMTQNVPIKDILALESIHLQSYRVKNGPLRVKKFQLKSVWF